MAATAYTYPAILEPDEAGRRVVSFPDLPEALTDGADDAEALREAADCLSEALASRIADGEEIPAPSSPAPGHRLVAPDPTIALKAALYMRLRHCELTVADLAARLDIDWHQAARLIDPKRSSKLTSLQAALAALGCRITMTINDDAEAAADAGSVETMIRTRLVGLQSAARPWPSRLPHHQRREGREGVGCRQDPQCP